MLSTDEITALSEPHPEFKPILESGSPVLQSWTLDTDIHEIRALIEQMRQSQQKPDPATLAYAEEDIEIPVRDGRNVAARVYKPREVPDDGCPGMCVFHGGGYVLGDFETEAWLCALFTSLGGIAVNIDYRHAPEHVFPAAIQDTHDATTWTAQNATNLGINPSKGFLLGGESSGAEMCLVVSHLCRDGSMSPPLTGVYAPAPGPTNDETVPEQYRHCFSSLKQNANAPILSAEALELIDRLTQRDRKSPLAFPIAFPDHSGLPKTYFQVCGLDPLRDCGLIMEQVYKDAGVATKMDIYPGLPHSFWAVFPELSMSKKHKEDAKKGLEWLLSP